MSDKAKEKKLKDGGIDGRAPQCRIQRSIWWIRQGGGIISQDQDLLKIIFPGSIIVSLTNPLSVGSKPFLLSFFSTNTVCPFPYEDTFIIGFCHNLNPRTGAGPSQQRSCLGWCARWDKIQQRMRSANAYSMSTRFLVQFCMEDMTVWKVITKTEDPPEGRTLHYMF